MYCGTGLGNNSPTEVVGGLFLLLFEEVVMVGISQWLLAFLICFSINSGYQEFPKKFKNIIISLVT